MAPLIGGWLDRLDATGRWALLKMLTGAPRVGVSARLAKTAVAAMGNASVDDVEEIWHGLAPPYLPLFEWLSGKAPKPDVEGIPVFRPLMLANPLEEGDLAGLDVGQFAVEWKWDGIRVQVVCGRGETRLYSRTGDDISQAFPDVVGAWQSEGVFDGELVVMCGGEVAPFSALQARLNRKTVTRRMLAEAPGHVRLYDVLMLGAEDLRALPFEERRARLEDWHAAASRGPFDLSPLVPVADKATLEERWRSVRGNAIEGLMLKRRASPYLAGRPKGHWYKWKRAALTIDCVLMYAQRGAGKRSSYYSDYTFGCWSTPDGDGEPELLPVGKAYFGFTDAEMIEIDRFIRDNTVERFGPVRRVRPGLVLEIAFDAVQRSGRHKCGVAMRFPRIHRIRWDKPAAEADRLEALVALIGT